MPLVISTDNPPQSSNFKLPFEEQIAFFRQKLNLPTERWDDIMKAAHDKAFIVAGAQKADLLNDLRLAVDTSIAEGKTIQWFRQEFEAIVAKNGWTGWTGEGDKVGRDWRTRVIYQTNLSTSYAAGRYQQLTDPDLLKVRPYWKYIHSDTVLHPRPLHQSWNGVVLRHDDPWWQTHFCPNGWGCRCRITAVRAKEYKGKPAPDDGTYNYVDKGTGEIIKLPKGIDYGWNYAPGANRTTPLKDIIDNKLINFPARIGADMWQALKPTLAIETQLQWTNTLTEWLKTPQKGRTAIVGAVDPDILDWVNSQKKQNFISAEVSIREGLISGTKQNRHLKEGDGLLESEWRRLPEIINNPDRILYDTQTGKILYIKDSVDSGTKLSVEFEYTKAKQQENRIVSGFRQSEATIAEKIRGGIYKVIK